MGKLLYQYIFQKKGTDHPKLVGKEVGLTCGVKGYMNFHEIAMIPKSEKCKPVYMGKVIPGGDLFAYKQNDGNIGLILSKIVNAKKNKIKLSVYENFHYGPIINSIDWLNEENQQICKNALEGKLNNSTSE